MDIVAVPHKLARITPDGVKLYSLGYMTMKVFFETAMKSLCFKSIFVVDM